MRFTAGLYRVLASLPTDGYFYTFLTNYSDQLVSFDNLTIHYTQGKLRAEYDYYPYGLPWGRVDAAYNETAMTTEFNANEWGIDGGLDMNFFAARFYDPVLARWHSPDPLEQFHSPYLAMCDDPVQQFLTAAQRRLRNANPDAIGTNFTDPDGRAGIPFLQDFMKSTLGECVIGSIGAIGGAFGIAGLMSIGGAIGNVVSGAISIGTTANSIKSVASLANQGRASIGASISYANTGEFVRGDMTSSSCGKSCQSQKTGNNRSCSNPNTIYLLITPDALKQLTSQGTTAGRIAKQVQRNFSDMKLNNVRIELWKGNPEYFDINQLSKTSGIAVFGGNRDDASAFIRRELDPEFADKLDNPKDYWKGGIDHPERSENNDGPYIGSPPLGGEIIAIDASALSGFGSRINLNDEADFVTKTASLIVVHGTGHLAGLNHDDNSSRIMGVPSQFRDYFNQHSFESLWKLPQGDKFMKLIMDRFIQSK